jgi:hypothetical protein
MKVIHPRGRPHDPFSRTQDASFVFNALMRRGYTWDTAREMIEAACMVSPRNVEDYRANKKLRAIDKEHEDNLARAAILAHDWERNIRRIAAQDPCRYPLPADLLARPN